jgi:hypothetical protein
MNAHFNIACPHCNRAPCLPVWRKWLLSPANSASCRHCGHKVSADVAHSWITLAVPLFLMRTLISEAQLGTLSATTAAFCILLIVLPAYFIFHLTWVPLVRYDCTITWDFSARPDWRQEGAPNESGQHSDLAQTYLPAQPIRKRLPESV